MHSSVLWVRGAPHLGMSVTLLCLTSLDWPCHGTKDCRSLWLVWDSEAGSGWWHCSGLRGPFSCSEEPGREQHCQLVTKVWGPSSWALSYFP